MNKTIRDTAIGALIGGIVGYTIENTSLIWSFIGTPAQLWMPGEPIDYAGRYKWDFVMIGIILGALIPIVVHKSFNKKQH